METVYKVNVINNWAFSFKVPLTLHIVFRAGSLVTNLLLSRLILKRQFSKSKYISVATITLGTLQVKSWVWISSFEFRNNHLYIGDNAEKAIRWQWFYRIEFRHCSRSYCHDNRIDFIINTRHFTRAYEVQRYLYLYNT